MNGIRDIGVIALGVLLAVPFLLGAKVYKSVLPDGTVVYSDEPPSQGAKEIELPQIQIYRAPPLPATSPAKKASADEFEGYSSFQVSSPANDETVRDNGGSVSISLALEPSLRRGHEVDIFVNGTSVGRGNATTATLTNVDRGSHTVYATIVGPEGDELARTPSVTFHLKRATRLSPTRRGG